MGHGGNGQNGAWRALAKLVLTNYKNGGYLAAYEPWGALSGSSSMRNGHWAWQQSDLIDHRVRFQQATQLCQQRVPGVRSGRNYTFRCLLPSRPPVHLCI